MYKTPLILLASALVIVLATLLIFDKDKEASQVAIPTVSDKPQINMNDKLYLLAKSDNPEKLAKMYSLNVKNGEVQVAIELNDTNFKLSPEYGTETARSNNKVDAWIKIDRLIELSMMSGVKSIQPPVTAVPFNK